MKKRSLQRYKPPHLFILLLILFPLTLIDERLLGQSSGQSEVTQRSLFLPLVTSPPSGIPSLQGDDPSANRSDQVVQAAALGDTGQWSGVIPTSFVPVSAANLPNGKVLLWSSYDRYTFIGAGTYSIYTSIFDPATNRESERLVTETGHDMFCPGTSNLADGRVLVSGGKNSATTSIYNAANNSWLKAADLNQGRGYHAQTVLSNGDVFTIGGSWSGGDGDKDGEIWNENTGWRFLSGIPVKPIIDGATDPEGIFRDDNHAWLWTASNGKVFHAGPASNMHWLDTSGNGSYSGAGPRGDDTYSIKGTTVMYDEGKILKAGGADNYSANGPANNRAYIIDISSDNASVKRVEDLKQSRTMHNSVVLPNGQVLVVGGLATGSVFTDVGARYTPELWDPATEQWTSMANMAVPRTYHSIALLLPDGRVMAGGGGLCGGCGVNHADVEIFSPPYLFNGNSSAVRPVITSAPTAADHGDTINVQTDSPITAFSLVRLSSATHSTNNDQRRIPLTPTTIGTNSYDLNISVNSSVLLPGYYMLFAMNAAGTPSVSTAIKIGSTPPPPPPSGDTYRYVRLMAESEVNGNPWTSMAEFNVLDDNGNITSRSGWSITTSSEETVGENGRAVNAIDGNPTTIWHTQWLGSSPTHPHEIVVDMGSARDVGGFRYLPRPGGGNGTIANYAFYVSNDGVNWGSPAAQGTFANNAIEKTVTLSSSPPPPPSGDSFRYVRLVAETEVNGNPWTSMAEFNVLDGSGNAISRSGWGITANSEETGGEDGRATNTIDGNPNTIWHTQWQGGSPIHPHEIVVDMGSAQSVGGFRYLPRPGGGNGTIANYAFYVSNDGVNWGSPVAQGTFANNAAEKTVTLSSSPPPPPPPPPPPSGDSFRYVRLGAESEVNGNPWTSMGEFNVLDGSGNAISRSGWGITANSEETGGEDGRAVNAIDGNPNTFWHTQWQGDSPIHPHEIVVDMGSAQSVGGFRYLPRPGGGSGTIANYAFYVSNDGVNWGSPVAQGTFANNAAEKTVTLP